MTRRDPSRDGLRNRLEAFVLGHFRLFWALVNRIPPVARFFNRLIIDNAVRKAPMRPLRLSTRSPYTSWDSLTDRTWFTRYLPPRSEATSPACETVAELFVVRPDGPRLSSRSTLLFPAFAQWFTDGFLLTDEKNRARTTTTHQIDLNPVYGIDPATTAALRSGAGGKLKSVRDEADEEWAPRLYDEAGEKKKEFTAVPDPLRLPSTLPAQKRATLFAFGGTRANSTPFTAMMNTLFLREHNRLASALQSAYPAWDDDRIFETARNINIVQLIRIVVEEYINHISPYWFHFIADPSACYRAPWNRPNWIPIEFNLLYRWHSLVPAEVQWNGKPLPSEALLFDNSHLLRDGLGRGFDSASRTRAWQLGLFNTVRFLHHVEAASVGQGRDNNLASYNDYREVMRYPRVTDFAQISSDPDVLAGLRRVYGDVDAIEYFVGLFAEDVPPRSAVPPLVGRMVAADAFSHALTNPLLAPLVFNEETFSLLGMKTIRETSTLADIVRRNVPSPDGYRVSMELEQNA